MQANKAQYIPVLNQPLPTQAPSMCCSSGGDEKHGHICDDLDAAGVQSHSRCHRRRQRQIFTRVLVGVFAVFLLFFAFYAMHACMGGKSNGEEGILETIGGLVKRATTSGTTGENSFTKNKLYLIVIFVGLVVVLILGVMLSAWCCRESFKNPLCCPCYLCACCGGLACLECIGCGLCAEGVEQF